MRRRVALGLLVGAVALALALWGVPLGEVARALDEVEGRWLLAAAAVFLVQQLLRSIRQVVLVRPLAPGLSLRTSVAVLCISFFCINSLPARLGELVRPTLLLERAGVPLGGGFALVFLERIIDLCSTLILLSMVGWLVPVHPSAATLSPELQGWLLGGRRVALVALPIAVGALLCLLALGRPLAAKLERWLAPPLPQGSMAARLGRGIHTFLTAFLEGLAAVKDLRRLLVVLGLTALTWTWSGLIYVALARGFEVESWIGWGQGLGVMCITMLGTILPAPPGFAGTYEASVRAGLAAFGVAGPTLDARAVAFALTVHWWLYAVQAATAIWFLVVDRIDLGRLVRQSLAGEGALLRKAGGG